jgi:hypothetical protein
MVYLQGFCSKSVNYKSRGDPKGIQHTNLFCSKKKNCFPTFIWTPIRDPKGIQMESKGNPKGIQRGSKRGTFETQAKDEIHAKKTFLASHFFNLNKDAKIQAKKDLKSKQRRILKSMQRRILKSMQRRILKSMQRRQLKSKEDFPTII